MASLHVIQMQSWATSRVVSSHISIQMYDWINETFKNNGSSDIYNLTFRGGGERLRYYTNVNLISNLGFIAHPKENSGYSTRINIPREAFVPIWILT